MKPIEPNPEDDLPLAAQDRIDGLCLEFEDALRSPQVPRIEDYLSRIASAERAALLRELLLVEWDWRERNGEQPSAEAYRERFPDFPHVVGQVARRRCSEDPGAGPTGQRMGRYRIERTIGEGTFGTVYAAWDEKLERPVAIKLLGAEVLAACRNGEQVLCEARAVANLRHPGIVAVYDVVEDDSGTSLVVMEYLPGETLRDALRTGRLTRRDKLTILSQIADAVDFAHRRGFVHRDLKPSNIRFDEMGRARVLDFGLAIHESIQKSRAGESAGSLAYMSPEQVRGESDWLDGRADVWALGVILYEMLAERMPFLGLAMEQLGTEILCREPKPLRQIDDQIPAELERICLKCLRKNVAERYATAADLAEDLRRFLAGGGHYLAGDPADGKTDARTGFDSSRRGRRAAGLFTAGIVMAVAAIAAAVWTGIGANRFSVSRSALVDLRVWDPADTRRRGVGIREAGAIPLRPGDQVRLEIELDSPAYPYIVWIDSEGTVSPVFPWQKGDWSQRPRSEAPVERLSLPAAADQAWTVKPSPPGMETVVVLARTEPWREAEDFFGGLGQLGQQAGSRPSVLEWRNGGIWYGDRSPTRAADLSATSPLIDTVILNQRTIAARLGNGFVLHHALSFPVANLPSGGNDDAPD